jgi:hypothetical protein
MSGNIRNILRNTIRPRSRGDVLPLALILMATLVIGAFTFGFVLLQSLLRSRELDASTVAYYAADAGIERQLYMVRKENANVSDLAGLSVSYVNGSRWEQAGSGFNLTNAKFFPEIKAGDFQFVDLFNPDQLDAAAGIAEVRWTWSAPSACKLEVAYAQWDTEETSILPEQFTIKDWTVSPGFQSLNPNKAYRLRFRPKACTITNLSVTAYADPSATAPAVAFPGDIIVASQGTYASTTQAISVRMPRLEILSGIFSYVIFSECTLYKDSTGGSPAC